MEPSFSVDWFTRRIPQWEHLLSSLRGKPQLQFLEIGSWEGRSACWLLQNIVTHPTSTLTCIDPFDGNRSIRLNRSADIPLAEQRFDRNILATGAGDRVRKMKGKSQDLLGTLEQCGYDFIYVDGSHDARDVLTDAVLSWRLLRPGGILVFDDYQWAKFPDPLLCPKMAIDAFLAVFKTDLDVLAEGWQVAVRKRSLS